MIPWGEIGGFQGLLRVLLWTNDMRASQSSQQDIDRTADIRGRARRDHTYWEEVKGTRYM